MELVSSKKFKLFGEPWTIKYYKGIDIPEGTEGYRYGDCNSASRVIRINTIDDAGKPHPKEVIETSLTHELVHAMLDSGQYTQSSQDEPMVEWLAKCIRQLLKQRVLQ